LDGKGGRNPKLEESLCRRLPAEREMEAAVVVLVLPPSELVSELLGGPEGDPPIELVFVGPMAALHLAVGFGTAARDPAVSDAQVVQVPGEVGGELGAVNSP